MQGKHGFLPETRTVIHLESFIPDILLDTTKSRPYGPLLVLSPRLVVNGFFSAASYLYSARAQIAVSCGRSPPSTTD